MQAWSLRTTGPRGALVRVARGAHLVEQPALLQPARRRLLLQLPQGESQRSSNMNRPHKNEACSSSSHKKPPRPSGGGGGVRESVSLSSLAARRRISRPRGRGSPPYLGRAARRSRACRGRESGAVRESVSWGRQDLSRRACES